MNYLSTQKTAVFDAVKRFYEATHEVLEVPIVGTLMAALLFNVEPLAFYLITERASQAFLDPTEPGLIEITFDQFSSIIPYVNGLFLGTLSLSILTNCIAIYHSARNNELISAIRLVATAENVNRLLYTMSLAIVMGCSSLMIPPFQIDSATLAAFCSSDFFSFIQNWGSQLQLINIHCQIYVSLSRFFAISFNGMFFKYTLKQPFFQFVVCLFLGFFDLLFGWFVFTWFSVYMLKILIAFTITIDFFTYRKIKKWKKNKVSPAEQRLMKQMILSSVIYFYQYVLTNLLIVGQYLFIGAWLQAAIFVVFAYITTTLFTLGQSTISIIFLKKTSRDDAERSTATLKSITVSPITNTQSTNRFPSRIRH